MSVLSAAACTVTEIPRCIGTLPPVADRLAKDAAAGLILEDAEFEAIGRRPNAWGIRPR